MLATLAGCVGGGDAPADMHEYASELDTSRWSANQRVANQYSWDTPGLVRFNGATHMVFTAPSNGLHHSIYDGRAWSAPVAIPNQSSSSRPALATQYLGDGSSRIVMVRLAEASNTLWTSTFTPFEGWTPSVQMTLSSGLPPVVVGGGPLGLRLFGTHFVNGNETLWVADFDGNKWSASRDPVTELGAPITGIEGFDVASYAGGNVMVVRGVRNDLAMYRERTDGRWSAAMPIVGQKSKSAPVLAWYSGLQMLHLGDTSTTIWWSTFDGTAWSPNIALPNQTSAQVPGLAYTGDGLLQVHTGSSTSQLWYATFR